MTQQFDNYATTKIQEAFIKMVKIEMLLSGKTFNESKIAVKEFLKKQGLL